MASLRSGDTIAAIATPAGAGGVGIVRVSGPSAGEVLARVLGRNLETLEDRRFAYGMARDLEGRRVDEVLAVLMRGPRSFTGEDVGEIHGHGGPANMARLLRVVLEAGARLAEAGEFTRRALENGRVDLLRAEAILGVIEASSERGLRLAQDQLGGRLGDHVRELRERGTMLLAQVEAEIDFPEEDIEAASLAAVAVEAGALAERLDSLVRSFGLGRALQRGVTVALTGVVNAGKSSLLNALVGHERALVADEPGTTRDYVEAEVIWDGVRLTLVDTAGERSIEAGVEARGIELGRERARAADLELVVVPPGQEIPAMSPRQLLVHSKSDVEESHSREGIATSARTGAGLESLRSAILARVVPAARDAEDGLVVTTERQRERLAEARQAMRSVAAGASGLPPELLAVELRTANAALAAVLGEEVGDEVLDELFARFCIGK